MCLIFRTVAHHGLHVDKHCWVRGWQTTQTCMTFLAGNPKLQDYTEKFLSNLISLRHFWQYAKVLLMHTISSTVR